MEKNKSKIRIGLSLLMFCMLLGATTYRLRKERYWGQQGTTRNSEAEERRSEKDAMMEAYTEEGYQRKEVSSILSDATLTYFTQIHGIRLKTTDELLTLSYGTEVLESVKTLQSERVFLLPYPLKEFIYITNGQQQEIVNTQQIVQNNATDIVFITKTNYFVRSDMSYVCTAALTLSAVGSCHPESYYLE